MRDSTRTNNDRPKQKRRVGARSSSVLAGTQQKDDTSTNQNKSNQPENVEAVQERISHTANNASLSAEKGHHHFGSHASRSRGGGGVKAILFNTPRKIALISLFLLVVIYMSILFKSASSPAAMFASLENGLLSNGLEDQQVNLASVKAGGTASSQNLIATSTSVSSLSNRDERRVGFSPESEEQKDPPPLHYRSKGGQFVPLTSDEQSVVALPSLTHEDRSSRAEHGLFGVEKAGSVYHPRMGAWIARFPNCSMCEEDCVGKHTAYFDTIGREGILHRIDLELLERRRFYFSPNWSDPDVKAIVPPIAFVERNVGWRRGVGGVPTLYGVPARLVKTSSSSSSLTPFSDEADSAVVVLKPHTAEASVTTIKPQTSSSSSVASSRNNTSPPPSYLFDQSLGDEMFDALFGKPSLSEEDNTEREAGQSAAAAAGDETNTEKGSGDAPPSSSSSSSSSSPSLLDPSAILFTKHLIAKRLQMLADDMFLPWERNGGVDDDRQINMVTCSFVTRMRWNTFGIWVHIAGRNATILRHQVDKLGRTERITRYIKKIVAESPEPFDKPVVAYINVMDFTCNVLHPYLNFFTKRGVKGILFPDDQVVGWGAKRRKIQRTAAQWPYEKKNNSIFFIGSPNNKQRMDIRDMLHTSEFANQTDITIEVLEHRAFAHLIRPIQDHTNYRHILSIRGRTASSRDMSFQTMNSTVLRLEDADTWFQWYHVLWEPYYHYIPLPPLPIPPPPPPAITPAGAAKSSASANETKNAILSPPPPLSTTRGDGGDADTEKRGGEGEGEKGGSTDRSQKQQKQQQHQQPNSLEPQMCVIRSVMGGPPERATAEDLALVESLTASSRNLPMPMVVKKRWGQRGGAIGHQEEVAISFVRSPLLSAAPTAHHTAAPTANVRGNDLLSPSSQTRTNTTAGRRLVGSLAGGSDMAMMMAMPATSDRFIATIVAPAAVWEFSRVKRRLVGTNINATRRLFLSPAQRRGLRAMVESENNSTSEFDAASIKDGDYVSVATAPPSAAAPSPSSIASSIALQHTYATAQSSHKHQKRIAHNMALLGAVVTQTVVDNYARYILRRFGAMQRYPVDPDPVKYLQRMKWIASKRHRGVQVIPDDSAHVKYFLFKWLDRRWKQILSCRDEAYANRTRGSTKQCTYE